MGRPVGSGTGGRPSLVRKTTSLALSSEVWEWMSQQPIHQAKLIRTALSLLMAIPQEDLDLMLEQGDSQAEPLRVGIALLRERREGKTKKSVKGL